MPGMERKAPETNGGGTCDAIGTYYRSLRASHNLHSGGHPAGHSGGASPPATQVRYHTRNQRWNSPATAQLDNNHATDTTPVANSPAIR